jgi:hypothetical protein
VRSAERNLIPWLRRACRWQAAWVFDDDTAYLTQSRSEYGITSRVRERSVEDLKPHRSNTKVLALGYRETFAFSDAQWISPN